MTTKVGFYVHNATGNTYRVIGTARVATNGPDEGKVVVLYLDRFNIYNVRDEAQFHELIVPPPERGFNPGISVPRFAWCGSDQVMTDQEASDLYDGLKETFGRKPAP